MQLWTDLLNFIDQLVSPDWGGLIALLPVGLALLIAGYVAWVMLRFATAAPTRRGPQRRPPRAQQVPRPIPRSARQSARDEQTSFPSP